MWAQIQTLSRRERTQLLFNLLSSLTYDTWQEFKEDLLPLVPDFAELVESFDQAVYDDALTRNNVNWQELYFILLEFDQYDPGRLEEFLSQQDYDQFYSESLESLPPETGREILKYLKHREIKKLCQTSQQLNSYCSSAGWGQIFQFKYLDIYQQALEFKGRAKNYEEILQSFENNNKFDSVEKAIYLVDYLEIDPTFKDNEAFVVAAATGQLEVLQYLLTLTDRFDINPAARRNEAFVWAARNGHLKVLEYLISLPEEFGINPEDRSYLPFEFAAEGGHVQVMDFLLNIPDLYEVNPAVYHNQIFISAAKMGQLESLKYLMSLDEEYDIDPADNGNGAFIAAAYNGHLEVLKYLMTLADNYDINPAARYNTAFQDAVKNSHLEILKYLVSLPERYQVDPWDQSGLAFIEAIGSRNIKIIRFMVSLVDDYDVDFKSLLERSLSILVQTFYKENSFETFEYLITVAKQYNIDIKPFVKEALRYIRTSRRNPDRETYLRNLYSEN